ncbi:acetaldehyde dehydrogenase (acetylating) [Fusibacter sp. 3D3]|uniref:acetaldehyde dehydrogenase (acetylating) n=1 Tax=Fusibacter sp. 3D3 TaxID=1048380 RepID=UPI000853626B|nr:acetaldehyde dehydrogenase (acetylating) [Fusibacter sp. 3D3]GAU75890.1 acetaldehyde dehydrogenase, ethanolamine utilization cluster [Fusibacter sp. 3D3]
MTTLDKDLASIQEVRTLVARAKMAQKQIALLPQEKIDEAIEGLSKIAYENAESLAKLAHEETGYGKWEDKKAKNVLASKTLCEYMRPMKTIGVIEEDPDLKILKIGTPMGVIAGLIPSTNPTSTVIYKALIAIKAGNSIVFSPHPAALKCITETVHVLREACYLHGLPEDTISCVTMPTIEATDALMKHADVNMILATGGSAMVKAAYSSGTPALGVGPGNVPAYIEKTADVDVAVARIFKSKQFDYGTVCASEQSIVTEKCIEQKVREAVIKKGGYFLRGEDLEKVKRIMERPNGGMNPQIVGRSAQYIAELAGIEIPPQTQLLVSDEPGIGSRFPFSKEKLTQLLGFYVVNDWQEACETCIALLENGGLGHSLAIHSNDESIIRAFAMKKPVSRFLVNTPSTHGAVGLTTGLAPSFTLGCGTVGGSATGDNVTPLHLINLRWVAYGLDEAPEKEASTGATQDEIAMICKMVLEQLNR